MHRSGVHFYLCALITLFAWHPCHADDALTRAQTKWDQTEKETDAAFTKYANGSLRNGLTANSRKKRPTLNTLMATLLVFRSITKTAR